MTVSFHGESLEEKRPASRSENFMLVRITALAAILIVLAGAGTREPNLFSQQKITTEQWQTLRTRVKTAPGAREVPRPEQPDVEPVEVPEEHTVYYFTRGGPAHPAVIACRSVTSAAMRSLFCWLEGGVSEVVCIILARPSLAPAKAIRVT